MVRALCKYKWNPLVFDGLHYIGDDEFSSLIIADQSSVDIL